MGEPEVPAPQAAAEPAAPDVERVAEVKLTITAEEVLEWMKNQPGPSWVWSNSIRDVETALASLRTGEGRG